MADDDLQRLLDAPIPVLSNGTILKLMDADLIRMSDFNPEKLSATAYQLSAHNIRFRNDDEDGVGPQERVYSLKDHAKSIRPGEYAIVSPKEYIELSEGLVADFYPSSWCIDKHLVLTAGRLDAHYKGYLIFGVYNAGRLDVEITSSTQIARATFCWLGRGNIPLYKGIVPGAYNKLYQDLREKEKSIVAEAAELSMRKMEIEKAIEALKTREIG